MADNHDNPRAPKRTKRLRFIEHDVENIFCDCDPLVMKLCPCCNGSESGCRYCHHFPPHFNGLVVADDPTADDLVVVHRAVTELVD